MSATKVNVRIFPLVVIATIVFLIYSNSFNYDWHMDDRPNIVNNRALHIENLMPDSIWQTFFANQGRAKSGLFRPIACLTFSINWYIGKDNTLGYHLVNVGIHVATAVALYFLFLRLLSILYKPDDCDAHYISDTALLAAVLWAINPIQIQAVTYIVQRMAAMAALFYVLSILYYVKARTSFSIRQRCNYFFLCALWFFCAIGSKENAILLPVSLVLLEWIFFQKTKTNFLRWPWTRVVLGGFIIAAILVVLVFTGADPIEAIRGWYGNRPFTLEERLFAQPRVVLRYLSQIFYPLPERFSIAHDIILSESLLHPWTTLPAIGLISILLAGSFIMAKRFPLFSFAIIFFFLNHVIESSVYPLEIIFEHRNYLPTLFLFLPVAAGIKHLLYNLRQNNRLLCGILAIVMSFMITSIGLSTYSRNEAWATEITLWADAFQKAPNHIRPTVTLAIKLAWRDNPSDADYNFALKLFHRALELPETARKTEKAEILNNIAGVYFNMGDNDRAIETYRKILKLDPSYLKNRADLIKPLILKGNFEEAAFHATYLIEQHPRNYDYQSLMGFIYLWEGRSTEALPYFQKALAYGPHSPNLMLNTGVALTRVNSFKNGRWFIKQSIKSSPGDLLPLLAIIESYARVGAHKKASEYARYTLYRFSFPMIFNKLDSAGENFRAAPIAVEYIEPFIKNELEKITSEIQ